MKTAFTTALAMLLVACGDTTCPNGTQWNENHTVCMGTITAAKACTEDTDCTLGTCDTANGICTNTTTVTVQVTCNDHTCPDDYSCDTGSGLCVRTIQKMCTANTDCADGETCDQDNGICTKTIFGQCTTDSQCPNGTCENGYCTIPSPFQLSPLVFEHVGANGFTVAFSATQDYFWRISMSDISATAGFEGGEDVGASPAGITKDTMGIPRGPAKTYWVRVTAISQANPALTVQAVASFTSLPDSPIVTWMNVKALAPTEATVCWGSDRATTTVVSSGFTPNAQATRGKVSSTSDGQSDSSCFTFVNLIPNSGYYYELSVTDMTTGGTTKVPGSFNTPL